jgi:F-box/TPR repeat protein Pof3
MKAIEPQRLAWITKYCKKLKDLQLHGRGMIGESLTDALKDAESLDTLYVSRNTEISLSAVQKALETCKSSLVTATFLNVQGNKGGFLAGRWVRMESIKTLRLEADGDSYLDLVSFAPQNLTMLVSKIADVICSMVFVMRRLMPRL